MFGKASFFWFCWWQSFRMTICRTKMTGSPGHTRPLMCIHMMSSWWPKICQSIYWSVKGGIGCYLMVLGHYTAVPVGTWWYWVGTGRYWLPVWYAFRKYMVSMVYTITLSSARARRACALRALGLLLADGNPTVGGGKTFWRVSRIFLRKQL